MYGWYSDKQAELAGTSVYLDTNGNEVIVTSVSESNDSPSFDDSRFVGQVTKWLRRNSCGTVMFPRFISEYDFRENNPIFMTDSHNPSQKLSNQEILDLLKRIK